MRDRQIINAHALRARNKYFFPGTPLLASMLLIQDQGTQRGEILGKCRDVAENVTCNFVNFITCAIHHNHHYWDSLDAQRPSSRFFFATRPW